MGPVVNWIEGLRQVRVIDLAEDFGDMLARCTAVEAERLLREYVEQTRTQICAARRCGMDARVLVRYHMTDCDLSGKAEQARATAHFAAGERGARIGAERAERMMIESAEYARNVISQSAPWLVSEEPEDD